MSLPLVAGLLLAPLLPCLAVATLFASLRSNWAMFPSDLLLMVLVAEAACIVLAGPAYVLLQRRLRVGLRHCLIAGALIGCLVGPVGLAIGVGSASIFWALVPRKSSLQNG